MTICPHCNKETETIYQTIIYKNKEFRIYKWGEVLKDFPIPEGFKWCEYIDFLELINENKIKLDKYPIIYYTKNQFKNRELSGFYLGRGSGLGSYDGDLGDSGDGGRVVVNRKIKGKK